MAGWHHVASLLVGAKTNLYRKCFLLAVFLNGELFRPISHDRSDGNLYRSANIPMA